VTPQVGVRVGAREARLVATLHAWGAGVRADLPWRRDREPWPVLVSEAMLQQTQVARVAPRFTEFVARWPTPAALAASPLSEVLAAWAGLGYYRRARDLHAAARTIVVEHGGRVPDDLAALRALPGVGAYTARAVLALAHGRDVGVVDTNVARVLARAVAGAPLTAAASQRLADALVPAGTGRVHTEALLDLGATVCTARAPRCDVCPLRRGCAWRRSGGGPGGRSEGSVPDPAATTAGTSRPQPRFEGSDRQGRGRLLAALRAGPVPRAGLAAAAGWPGDIARAERIADELVADGLAAWRRDALVPPA
jgi:A/G-specific adenine glycosylase